MRRLVLGIVAAVALALPAVAGAQAGVDACIAANGPRYNNPGDASTAQYVGVGGLCRDGESTGADVTITPTPRRGTTTSTPAATPPPATPVTPSAPPTSTPSGTTTTPPATTPRPAPAPSGGTKADAPAPASNTVKAALNATPASAGPSLPGVAGAPGGVGGSLLVLAGLAGAGLVMRRLPRR